MMSEIISSGVTSDLGIEKYKSVELPVMKTQIQKKERQYWKIIQQNTNCEADGCPKCGRNFLRPTSLAKHTQTCNTKDRKRKTAEEV